MEEEEAKALAQEKVEFWPERHQKAIENLASKLGQAVLPPISDTPKGAGTASFNKVTKTGPAPVGGIGPYRIGEDGHVYMASKAEHYHIPLGHRFPGYQLLQNARKLGILNATHNNSRGYITRMTERKLIATANGLEMDDPKLDGIIAGEDPKALCRVLNINTGSLAVWAAAWSSALDPDMYQVYHKDSTATSTLAWGYNYLKNSGTPEEMDILDELSDYIDQARETNDQAVRSDLYQQAMEQVLDLAIELPVYQRSVLYAFNSKVINADSMPAETEMNPYSSPLDRIWEVEFAA